MWLVDLGGFGGFGKELLGQDKKCCLRKIGLR
jgi:hypothetical protein